MSSTKLPPLMQRRLRDDLKGAGAVLTGGIIGWLLFAADDFSMLLGGVIGVALTLVVVNILRPLVRRVQANRKE